MITLIQIMFINYPRKQSFGYIGIGLSVPLSARLFESCLANNFLIMDAKLTYIGTQLIRD